MNMFNLKKLWENKLLFIGIIVVILTIVTIPTAIIINNNSSSTTKATENKKYSIQFESNGGSKISKQSIQKGGKVIKPSDPNKEGFIFVEWQLNGKTYDFNQKVTNNFTLLAFWKDDGKTKKYTITFDTDGGSKIEPILASENTSIIAPLSPTKKEYTFLAWMLGETEFSFDNLITGDITLKAKWEIKKTNTSIKTDTETNKNINEEQKEESQNQNTNTTITTNKSDIKIPVYVDEPSICKVEYTADGIVKIYKAYNGTRQITGIPIEGYEFYRSLSKDGNYVKIGTSNSLDISISNLDISKPYYYKVRSFGTKDGEKAFSNYGEIISVPSANTSLPTNINFSNNYNHESRFNTQIQISLENSTPNGSTQIYSSDTPNGTYVRDKIISGNNGTITWQTKDVYYKFQTVILSPSNSNEPPYLINGALTDPIFIPKKELIEDTDISSATVTCNDSNTNCNINFTTKSSYLGYKHYLVKNYYEGENREPARFLFLDMEDSRSFDFENTDSGIYLFDYNLTFFIIPYKEGDNYRLYYYGWYGINHPWNRG